MAGRRLSMLISGAIVLAAGGAAAAVSRVPVAAAGGNALVGGPIEDVSFADASHGWAVDNGGDSPALLATADGGLTWTPQTITGLVGSFTAVHALDVQHVIAVTSANVYLTSDGGAIWRPAAGGFADTSPSGVAATDNLHAWVAGRACAVTCNGVVERTADAGLTWTPSVIGSGTASDPEALAFSDTHHGWAVGLFGLLARTTDGGQSWTVQTPPTTPHDTYYYAVAATGVASAVAVGRVCPGLCQAVIATTKNGGTTWTSQSVPVNAQDVTDVAFGDATHGWAVADSCTPSGCSTGNVLATTNGGTTWAVQATNPGRLSVVTALSATRAWAAGQHCAASTLQTTADGTTWTTVVDNSSSMISAQSLSFSTMSSGWAIGVEGCGVHQIVHTTNGGASWGRQTAPGGATGLVSISAADATHAWADGESNAFTQTGGVIGATGDGINWATQDTPSAQLSAVQAIDASNAIAIGYFYNLSSTAIASTTDGGVTWTEHVAPLPMTVLSFADASHGWVGGGSCAVPHQPCQPALAMTADGGATWTNQPVPGNALITGLSFPDTAHGWVVTANGGISITADGGATWSAPSSTPNGVGSLAAVHFVDDLHGWAVGSCDGTFCSGALVISTTDGGQDWTLDSIPATLESASTVTAADASHVWVGGAADCGVNTFAQQCQLVLASGDGGQTWSPQLTGSTQ